MGAEDRLFQITRTNTKRYVGICNYVSPDDTPCEWRTDVVSLRLIAAERVRDHCRRAHNSYAADLFLKKEAQMKQPSNELPEQDKGEKLGDYKDHLIIVSAATEGSRNTSFGDRPTIEALVYVWWENKAWKALGEIPIFWATVRKQILDADGEDLCGLLTQGTDRNDREWALQPVPASDKTKQAAIKKFDAEHTESF